jgi:hypothetical protein
VLWTNYYSEHFVLFIALAVLQSHRDVLLRYLADFDEVLKYFVDVSMTVSRANHRQVLKADTMLTCRLISIPHLLKPRCCSCPSEEWWRISIKSWKKVVRGLKDRSFVEEKARAGLVRGYREQVPARPAIRTSHPI